MKESKPSYAGIKQLAKEFAITIPKARKALKASNIMDANGLPVKTEYAILKMTQDQIAWYAWDEQVATKAFIKFGLNEPSEIERYSHVQNKHQADGKIDNAVVKIGEISGLEEAYEAGDESLKDAYSFYQGCMYDWWHGKAGAAVDLSSKDDCVSFINKLHRAIDDYESTCRGICKTKKQIEEIAFYASAIRRIADWVQLQFFR